MPGSSARPTSAYRYSKWMNWVIAMQGRAESSSGAGAGAGAGGRGQGQGLKRKTGQYEEIQYI